MPFPVTILYSGIDAFAPQPTPFIGLTEDTIYAGERWAVREVMTLNGQITGCTFGDIVSGQKKILNSFNQSYQTLQIWQNTGVIGSGLIYQKDLVEIQSIDFPQSLMVGIQPYIITLSCYPSNLFSGYFGVLDPSDNWDFQEQQDATLNIVHSISCRAFNTSPNANNALINARTWAFGRSGLNSTVYPILISGVSPSNFCILSQTETIDRFNGTYNLTETYTNDLARTGYGVIRYNTTIDSGNNLITLRLNGSAEGGSQNLSGIRIAFAQLDKVAIAAKSYQYSFNRTDLNPIPLTQNFSENPALAKIDFDYTFNNDNTPEISFDYTVSLSVGVNGAITANIEGIIRARGGTLPSKLARTQAYADTVNLYYLVLPFYNSFDTSSISLLNPDPTSDGRSVNQSDGTVSLNATFINEEQTSLVLDRFDYNLNFTKAVEKIDSRPVLDGFGVYSLVDLGFANRASLNINGTAVVNPSFSSQAGIYEVKQRCLQLFNLYGRFSSVVLDQDDVTTNRSDGRLLSYSFTWSFDGSNVCGPQTIPSLII